MSDFITPLLLSTLLSTADYKSTQYFHDRGYQIRELSPIKNNQIRAVSQFGLIFAGDLVIQKKAPKYKWHYRIGITLIVGAAVGNNIAKRK